MVCDTVHDGLMVMVGDHMGDHVDVNGYDAAGQSIDVIRRQGPYNWK